MAQFRDSGVDRNLTHSIDWWLIVCYLLFIASGLLNIYSSIHSTEGLQFFDMSSRVGKQFLWAMISLGCGLMIVFVIRSKIWDMICIPAYFLILVLLVAVIFMGSEIKGSRSWFSFGPVSFQPAEISKITTSLFLSLVLSRPEFKLQKFSHFMTAAVIIAVPMLIIVAESETGSALVYLGFLIVLYREGMSGWIIAFIGAMVIIFILSLTASPLIAIIVLTALVALYYLLNLTRTRRNTPERRTVRLLSICAVLAGILFVMSTDFVFNSVLQDHQRSRIEVLLGMKEDPSGIGYNVRQSMIAIGSGGFFGKGYLQGTQTTYGFVPEQSTDFIFCTVGEEWGFLGCLWLIALFVLFIFRLISDAESCRDPFTRVYGYCVASCMIMHLIINVGMTIGLMPVIGIPLPFISYGGSSLLSFSLMFFIFIALLRYDRKYF